MKTFPQLFSICFVLCFHLVCNAQQKMPRVEQGVINLRSWNFEEHGEVKLDGSWLFNWKELVAPDEVSTTAKSDYFDFPAIWNEHSSVYHQLSGQGYATYRADVLLDSSVLVLALSLPDFYCSYKLWVNGSPLAANGEVGTGRRNTVAQWRPVTVVIPANEDTLHLVLHVSNFQHHKGGCANSIYLGLPKQQYEKRELAVISNIVLFGGLMLIGAFFIALYFFFKHEKAALYFAAICITWAIRSLFTNLYLFINWFPDFDFELGAKIEYLTLYLTTTWSIFFVSHLFPEDTNQKVRNIILLLNAAFILATLASPAFTYSMFLSGYLVLIWIILSYVAFVVVMAIIYGRKGAWFSVGSILLGIVMFGYDLVSFSEYLDFSPLAFNVGYISIFLLNATAFAYQLSKSTLPGRKVEVEWLVK